MAGFLFLGELGGQCRRDLREVESSPLQTLDLAHARSDGRTLPASVDARSTVSGLLGGNVAEQSGFGPVKDRVDADLGLFGEFSGGDGRPHRPDFRQKHRPAQRR